jgi:Ran GTPase-activating protein (RanGAP) involved in mRNA processing and transport
MDGYGGYIWTTRLQLFDGDTALHLALKQKKRKCAGMLIFLGASTQLRNAKGELAEDICRAKYGCDLTGICRDARKEILPLIDPRGFDFVPKELRVHNVVKEAWTLMRAGRMLYTEIPKSFTFDDIDDTVEKVNNWVRCLDEQTKTAYMWNQKTGESRGLDEKEEKELATHWVKEKDPIGRKYYLNQVTGATTWEKPQYYDDSDDDKEEEDEDEILAEMKRIRQLEAVEELKQQKLAEEALARGISPEEEALEQERKKKERNEKRKQQKQQEFLTGISCTPAALAQGDSFGRDRISDMVQILEKQNLRYRKIEQAEALQHSGLALMKAVAVNGDEQEYPAGVSDDLLRNLPKLEGLKRLRFIRIQAIHKMMSHLNADKGHKNHPQNENNDLEAPIRFITELSTQTNLKYYNIGDSGLSRLNKELHGNKFITRISLNAARLTSTSICELASILKTIHALVYLDLSQNAICDKGVCALAEVIVPDVHTVTNVLSRFSLTEESHQLDSSKSLKSSEMATKTEKPLPLKTLVLSANRITSFSAQHLVRSFCQESCKLQRVLLKRNPKIDRDTQRALKKEVNECNEMQEKKYIASFTNNCDRSLSPPKKSLDKAKRHVVVPPTYPPFAPKQLDI